MERPERVARKIDTEFAPPLGDMVKEGNDLPDGESLQEIFKHLARRNLRRGYNLRLPTGQAVHGYLRQIGAITSSPIDDVSTILPEGSNMRDFLKCIVEFDEPDATVVLLPGGGRTRWRRILGEVGSWLVASTIIGVPLSDPDSAPSRGFNPSQSPLKMPDNSPIDSIAKWMQFAVVME